MNISTNEKILLTHALSCRIETLKSQIEEWDAIPDDAMVDHLTRHFVRKAKEDLPELQKLVKKFTIQ